MEFIRGRLNIGRRHQGCVATIGNFDGVHLGHRAVIAQLRRRAAELRRPSMMVVFEPQPQEYFRGNAAPPRLSSLRDKLALLSDLGIDFLLCLRFDRSLARTSARDFVNYLLVDRLNVHHLVVGDDFRFGRGRQGNFATLAEAGRTLGFGVEAADTCQVGGARVSSTRIRGALASGHFNEAERLLGRAFRITGRVTHGDRRGREWGFPTANVIMDRRRLPCTGIYAAEVFGLGATPQNGVASIGVRPTLPGPARAVLEVFLLDFDGDIYGRRIEVELMKRIRDEERFENFAALRRQIAVDVEQARAFFAQRGERGTSTSQDNTNESMFMPPSP